MFEKNFIPNQIFEKAQRRLSEIDLRQLQTMIVAFGERFVYQRIWTLFEKHIDENGVQRDIAKRNQLILALVSAMRDAMRIHMSPNPYVPDKFPRRKEVLVDPFVLARISARQVLEHGRPKHILHKLRSIQNVDWTQSE